MTLPPLMQRPDGKPVATEEDRERCRAAWRQAFADRLYGPIPKAPDRLDFRRERFGDGAGERLVIDVTLGGETFAVDAALWLPQDRSGPVPPYELPHLVGDRPRSRDDRSARPVPAQVVYELLRRGIPAPRLRA